MSPARYLALGDSYTIGEGVAEPDRWPAQLVRLLRAQGHDIADPEFVARSGWTTDELQDALRGRPPGHTYGLVTLLIGVNNQYRGRSAAEFRDQLRSLVAFAVDAAGGVSAAVILVSLPDWGVTPFNVSRGAAQVAADIDAFNAVVKAEAARAGAAWVDVTSLSRTERSAVVDDGLHPNADAYARWAERLAAVADAILRRH